MTNQLQTQNKRDISTDTSVWTFQDIKRYYDPQDLLTEKQGLKVVTSTHC